MGGRVEGSAPRATHLFIYLFISFFIYRTSDREVDSRGEGGDARAVLPESERASNRQAVHTYALFTRGHTTPHCLFPALSH